MLGKLLDGRYHIIGELAAGGFSKTYLAEDFKLPGNPKCVVKHLSPANTDPFFADRALELFRIEAETLQNLGKHDRIPQLYAYFEQDGGFYIIQELIEGRSLRLDLIPGAQLSTLRVAKILQDVLEILKFVHSRRVIHRDIKPANLIRRSCDHRLVLIDFGTAKRIDLSNAYTRYEIALPIGTPGYMPSEQEKGDACPSSDIYTLGMLALQALTGKHPSQFKRTPNGEILWRSDEALAQCDLTFDRTKERERQALSLIIDKMVSRNPSDRYQSADEAIAALNKLPMFETDIPQLNIGRKFEYIYSPWQIITGVSLTVIAVIMTLNFCRSLCWCIAISK